MKLLLAEDEIQLSKALVAVLRHHSYTVDAVYDGQEALDYLDNEHYDGVILDWMMPRLENPLRARKCCIGMFFSWVSMRS